MDLLFAIVAPAAVLVSAWWLTGRVRQYALERRLLDVPNARSSHSVATPRGGGMAIVVTTLVAIVAAGAFGLVPWLRVLGLLGSGMLVAGVGFADDHGHVPPRWRFLGHIAAAAWLLACVGGPPALQAFGTAIDLRWAGPPLAAMYLVWLINLTNFMDGIDGIAAIEVVTVSLGGVLLCVVTGQGIGEWIVPLVLASATLGFLVWNWPPARIFMGDAGSGFAGLMLGALSLLAGWANPPLLWSWIILLGAFVVDATITLGRRAIRGDRFYEPHRTHAYQHAAHRRGAHAPVTLAVAAINLCWLLPIAMLVAVHRLDGLTGVLVAYAPLAAVVLWFGAGTPHTPPSQPVRRHV